MKPPLFIFRVAVLVLLTGMIPALAEADDNTHLGVASCATGVCHGKLNAEESGNVWLNEYRIWSADDRHARAYQTLLTQESRLIATKLGLPNAQGAKICLDCHADNVPQSRRGPKFQLSDGVGCEACHGGAELWIETHTERNATHADNVRQGMQATEDVDVRAGVCLSCHLGAEDRFASHQIMGAGHPRLSFELEAYSANQPAHFEVDADYEARKAPSGKVRGYAAWRAGQVQSARRFLDLINSDLYTNTDTNTDTNTPTDFSFYDCHGCHHPMDDVRWSELRRQQGLKPGLPRLQDQHLLMLRAVANALAPAAAPQLKTLQETMLRAGQHSVSATKSAAAELAAWLDGQSWLTGNANRDPLKDARSVRKAIAALGVSGTLADYAAAEQAFLGIESLSLFLGDSERLQSSLDAMYDAVESDQDYRPEKFRQAIRALAAQL